VRPGATLRAPRRAVLAAAVLLAACGYGFSARYVARGGAARIEVRTFENRSTEPELGAAITTALRTELARRGADAGGDADAFIEGEVRALEPVLTSAPAVSDGTVSGGTWRIAVAVHARLVAGGATVAEHAARREADYLVGADALETEGRRALALRRLADDAAREVLRAFERGGGEAAPKR
jgi:lipopolysaccharide assembly LptE-like protein